MANNERFRALYNRLDSYAKSLAGIKKGSGIYLLIKILDPKTAAELNTLRGLKNSIVSHNGIDGQEPIVPRHYIEILENILSYISQNERIVKERLIKVANQKGKSKDGDKPKGNNQRSNNNPVRGGISLTPILQQLRSNYIIGQSDFEKMLKIVFDRKYSPYVRDTIQCINSFRSNYIIGQSLFESLLYRCLKTTKINRDTVSRLRQANSLRSNYQIGQSDFEDLIKRTIG